MTALIVFEWDGEAMRPMSRFAKVCDERFVVGERYRMEPVEERSMRSHRFFFASVEEGWLNLPEDLAERFPSPDHLRKWCLIKAGFCNHYTVAAPDAGKARHIAAVMRKLDGYAVIVPEEYAVTVYTAKSQNLKSMNKIEFQQSKDAVLGKISEMLGVTVEDLKERAKVTA